MDIGQWHGRSPSWCTAQPGNAMAGLSFVSLRWLPKETFDLSYSVKYLWGSGDLLEQAFCKPYCEVLRDIANNLTGGKLSVLLRALSLSFPSAKNKHCSHWMMKSVQPLFIWLFCVKDKEALVLKMGVKRARKEVKKNLISESTYNYNLVLQDLCPNMVLMVVPTTMSCPLK